MTASPAIRSITPARTVLMLMDFQPAILGALPDSGPVLAAAQRALGWARAHEIKVVFVRVAFQPGDYDRIPHHHQAFGSAKANRLLPDGDPSLVIDPSLPVEASDVVVRKTRFGAFSTTDLHAVFGDESIDTLVLGGISTAGVVLSTVRDASDQDYRIFVLSDASDDPDDEVHRVLIEKVIPRQADVIASTELDGLVS